MTVNGRWGIVDILLLPGCEPILKGTLGPAFEVACALVFALAFPFVLLFLLLLLLLFFFFFLLLKQRHGTPSLGSGLITGGWGMRVVRLGHIVRVFLVVIKLSFILTEVWV